MTIEQLDQLHKAQPFQPFGLYLADGTRYRVVSPEFLMRSRGGRTIAVSAGEDAVAVIDLLLVTKITVGNGARRRRRRTE